MRPRGGSWGRTVVAVFGHAPGLWLCYGESLPRELKRRNLFAALATVLALAAVAALVRGDDLVPALLVCWGAAHLLWGTYLAWRLRRRAPPL